jgi:hypothetical protein
MDCSGYARSDFSDKEWTKGLKNSETKVNTPKGTLSGFDLYHFGRNLLGLIIYQH